MGPTATTPFVNALVSGQLAAQNNASRGILQPSVAPTSTPKTAAPTASGNYWLGQDGNYYTKIAGQTGVQNVGKSYTAPKGVTQISDPDPGGVNPNVSNTGAGVASTAAPAYQDKSNDITLQNAGLGAVDATQQAAIDKINAARDTVVGQYEGDLGTAKTEYGANSDANENDLQSNKQTSLENAVQGRQGLYSTLASLGALNGTGLDLANNAVQKGANTDLTTAADTYATNQRGLDTSYNTYTTNEQRAEQKAKDAATNDITQAQNDAAKSRQAYLTNLANDYQAEGNTTQAKNFAAQAAALFPSIAGTNVPTIDLGYTGAAYTAPTLGQYVGKANNTTVNTTPAPAGSGVLSIPGLIATNKRQTSSAGTNGVV